MNPFKNIGGIRSILYSLNIGRKIGFLKLLEVLASKNTCKTCALGMGGQSGGMKNEQGHWPEICKKSIQAIAADMQNPINSQFFYQHSINDLKKLSSLQLEQSGRIKFPLFSSSGDKNYYQISWEDAFDKIEKKLKKTDPDRSFFYFSGRSSNEAGFLLQLFARIFGTNHINNCSYYCHQASGVGLTQSIGTGTATIELEDLDRCDLFFLIGANPSSNHPRLLTKIKNIRRRGGKVIVINPGVDVKRFENILNGYVPNVNLMRMKWCACHKTILTLRPLATRFLAKALVSTGCTTTSASPSPNHYE